MNTRMSMRQVVPLLIAAVIVSVIGLLLVTNGRIPAIQLPSLSLSARTEPAGTIDSPSAAEISAQRWQAMADFYEKEGLLTRDAFDYEAAAGANAARWIAMANFYEREGMLNVPFDPAQAAEISAQRWQAMANFYEKEGLLTRDAFDYEAAAEAGAARWLAMARFYEREGLLNEK